MSLTVQEEQVISPAVESKRFRIHRKLTVMMLVIDATNLSQLTALSLTQFDSQLTINFFTEYKTSKFLSCDS